MYTPRVGVITLGDPREEVPWREKEDRKHRELLEKLREIGELEVYGTEKVVRSLKEAESEVEKLLVKKPDLALLHIPVWTYPSITVRAAEVASKEVALLVVYGDGVLSGILASGGALSQVGIRRELLWGPMNEENLGKLVKWARAAMTVKRLRGMTYGVFGGRALGMYTVVADPSQIKMVFGVDVEHVDQLEILRKAEKIPDEEVEKHYKWLVERVGKIEFDGKILTEEKLKKQIRAYLALKELIKEHGFDFCGVKCQPELSDKYVNLCVAVALLNDPYDAEGPKEPIVCACEVDHDGALTMQILKIVSGGKPATLMDFLVYDAEEELLYLGNCGGMATWFAETSDKPEENLKNVHLLPQVQGKAGGAATQYVAPEKTFTLARLYRIKGEYHMVVLKAESIRVERSKLKKSIWPWPHIVVKINREKFNNLIETIRANHLHAVEGDYTEELSKICELLNIKLHRIQ